MRISNALVNAVVVGLLGAGCSDDKDGAGAPDAATGPDGAPGVDGAPADADDPSDLCGQLQTDVEGITGTEGLAIADDGTLYYSQGGTVGRVQPGAARDDDWATLDGNGDLVWGLATTATHLYVGYPDDDSIWRVDVATGDAESWLTDAGSPNGVIIGGDGALYYSDFSGGEVYRVDLTTKERTQVTDPTPPRGMEIRQPNGLYAVDATHLLVLAYGAGQVWELTLDGDGVETGRVLRATVEDASLDGITRGADGRWYLTDNGGGRVIERPADFAEAGQRVVSTGTVASAANLVFGKGALACNDLYVTSSSKMVRITID